MGSRLDRLRLLELIVVIASCQSGAWKSVGGSNTGNGFQVFGPSVCGRGAVSIASCPAGTRLVSGGYQMTAWSSGKNAPDTSMPNSPTSWKTVVNGDGSMCNRSVIICE